MLRISLIYGRSKVLLSQMILTYTIWQVTLQNGQIPVMIQIHMSLCSTMNPNAVSAENRRKVIRGGSWKDVAYFLQVSTRDYEYQDSARSYIGFRTVQDYMGEQDSTN